MGQKNGFTLIELLVVIAIIAILAAILFPVFVTAKGRGQQAACMQNMKQISVALQSYLSDWDDAFPMNRYRDPLMPAVGKMDGTRFNWKTSLQAYMKTKGDVWSCVGNFNRTLPDETGREVPATYPATAYPRSYALNGDYFNRLSAGGFDLPLLKSSSIARTSKLIFIVESRFDAPDLTSGMLRKALGFWESDKKGRGWINVHHGKMSNFVFADTHVQTMKVPKSFSPESYWADRVPAGLQDEYNKIAEDLPPDCY